ncbi:MAG: 30S ribosome-binding factor RbfA [Sulfurospirillum sp.]|nr:30S ribosome-binding factor RbfA [Sulfurospirillum sp.]
MDKSIKLQRTQSVLKQLIPEALSSMNDVMLRGVCVIDVDCTRGKYDATVYIDPVLYDADEKKYILEHLQKASRSVQNYCMQMEGWYRCPNLHFKFDDSLKKQNDMDALFEQVAKELHKGEKS